MAHNISSNLVVLASVYLLISDFSERVRKTSYFYILNFVFIEWIRMDFQEPGMLVKMYCIVFYF